MTPDKPQQPSKAEVRYTATVNNLRAVANVILQLDLEGLISANTKADLVGPIRNPTLYMQAQASMGRITRLAKAALKFQRVARDIMAEERGPEPEAGPGGVS